MSNNYDKKNIHQQKSFTVKMLKPNILDKINLFSFPSFPQLSL